MTDKDNIDPKTQQNMSKPAKHEAVDNWVGGIALAVISIGVYVTNLVTCQNSWLPLVCAFFLGVSVMIALRGIRQEIFLKRAKQDAEKAVATDNPRQTE